MSYVCMKIFSKKEMVGGYGGTNQVVADIVLPNARERW